ncbi:MAG: TolC family protein, partial [Kofleriaceae bacterium]
MRRRGISHPWLWLVAGCMVGPRYDRARAPVPRAAHYREAGDGQVSGIGTWKIARPSDAMLRGKWWKVFREPELDALVERLEVNNQTIRQAFENYMAARAQIRIARSQYAPTVTVSPSVTVSRSGAVIAGGAGSGVVVGTGSGTGGTGGTGSGGGTGGTGSGTGGTGTGSGGGAAAGGRSTGRHTVYSLPFEATWAPDLFGRVRYAVRQAQYGAQVSAADLENQRLVMQSTLVQTYFQLRGQDALQKLLDDTVAVDLELVELARARYETGVDTELAVVQAEQTLETARVQAVNARIQRAQLEHAIATLLGVPATTFSIP